MPLKLYRIFSVKSLQKVNNSLHFRSIHKIMNPLKSKSHPGRNRKVSLFFPFLISRSYFS